MAAPATIISAGRLYTDLVFTGVPNMPEPGREVFCDGLALHPGGGAFITAAYFAGRGHETHLLTTLPVAPWDGVLTPRIKDHGIGLGLARPAENGRDPQLTVAIVEGNDRAFLTRRDGPALTMPETSAFGGTGAKHLHIGELSTLVEHPELVTLARDQGMSVSLDCSWDSDLFTPAVAALIARVDVFLPNAAEAEALIRGGVRAPFAPMTVIKSGADGARLIRDGCEISAPAEPAEMVDPTGAGDAFNAGFLSSWLSGSSPETALRAGNRAGAAAVSERGGAAAAQMAMAN